MNLDAALFAGHSANTTDPERLFEHQICRQAVRVATNLLFKANVSLLDYDDAGLYAMANDVALRRKVELCNAHRIRAVGELHLNADGGRVNYSTTLYCDRSTRGQKLAQAVHSFIAPAFPWPSRGARGRLEAQSSGRYWLEQTQAWAFLCEPAFKDYLPIRGYLESPAFAVQYGSAVAMGLLRFLAKAPP